MFEVLEEKRFVSSKSVSRGVWDRNMHVVTVHTTRGPHFQSIGRSVNGRITLYLEEACFLMNMSSLEVTDELETPITFRDMYTAVLNASDGWCSYDRYQVLLLSLMYSTLITLSDVSLSTDLCLFEKTRLYCAANTASS
jgi:hypothetical protein